MMHTKRRAQEAHENNRLINGQIIQDLLKLGSSHPYYEEEKQATSDLIADIQVLCNSKPHHSVQTKTDKLASLMIDEFPDYNQDSLKEEQFKEVLNQALEEADYFHLDEVTDQQILDKSVVIQDGYSKFKELLTSMLSNIPEDESEDNDQTNLIQQDQDEDDLVFSSQESEGHRRWSRKRSKSPKKGVLRRGTSKSKSPGKKTRFDQPNPKAMLQPLARGLAKKFSSKTSNKRPRKTSPESRVSTKITNKRQRKSSPESRVPINKNKKLSKKSSETRLSSKNNKKMSKKTKKRKSLKEDQPTQDMERETYTIKVSKGPKQMSTKRARKTMSGSLGKPSKKSRYSGDEVVGVWKRPTSSEKKKKRKVSKSKKSKRPLSGRMAKKNSKKSSFRPAQSIGFEEERRLSASLKRPTWKAGGLKDRQFGIRTRRSGFEIPPLGGGRKNSRGKSRKQKALLTGLEKMLPASLTKPLYKEPFNLNASFRGTLFSGIGSVKQMDPLEESGYMSKAHENFAERYAEDWTEHVDPEHIKSLKRRNDKSFFRINNDLSSEEFYFDEDGNLVISNFHMLSKFVKDTKMERMALEEIGGLSVLNMSLSDTSFRLRKSRAGSVMRPRFGGSGKSQADPAFRPEEDSQSGEEGVHIGEDSIYMSPE